jgi:hypothetical protein
MINCINTATNKIILLVVFCTLIFSINVNALTLKSEVDKTSITREETLNLIVSVDENTTNDIDFTQLSYQFDIIKSQRSSRVTISNGKKLAKTFWVLVLAPKEIGKLSIPSFTYKNAFSSSITITVTDQMSASNNSDNPEIFFELISDKNKTYVQEQILVTARLYYKIPLANYEHEGLKVDKARVEQVFEKNKEATFRGQRYKVLEEIYTIHPQASGQLIVPVQTWRLEKPSRRFGIGNSTNPYVYVRSEKLTIDVLPIPEHKTNNTDWLPSEKITLSALWKQSPLQAIIGEPLNLQITINAQGLADYQIPNLMLNETAEFTVFEAQPETNNIKDNKGITGIRKLNYTIIPRKTGQFTLPIISINWWNVNIDKEEIFTLPEQIIVVAKSTIADTSAKQNQVLPILQSTQVKKSEGSMPVILWQIVSSVFFIVICFLFYQLYTLKKQPVDIKSNRPKNVFLSQQKIIINHIKIHIENKNWQQLRKELINWGQLTCKDETLDSLNKLAVKIPELALHLQQLDNYLYGQHIDDSYNPNSLLELIIKYKPSTHTNKKSVLKELYTND